MSIVNTLALESNRQIKINFYGGDLSSDAGLLLIKEFISKLGIDTLLEKRLKPMILYSSLYLKKMRLHHSLRYQDSLIVWIKTL